MADTAQAIDDTRKAQAILEQIRALPQAQRFGPLIKPQVDTMRAWIELALVSGLGMDLDEAQTVARLVVVKLARGSESVAAALLAVRADRAAR